MQKGQKFGTGGMGATLAATALLASASLAGAAVVTFQMGDGQTGSLSARDSWIINSPATNWSSDGANTNNGGDTKLRIRTLHATNGERHALLAWPNLIGAAADQIPAGATITSATLRLTTQSNSAGSTWLQTGIVKKDWTEGTAGGSVVYGGSYTNGGVTWNKAISTFDQTGEVAWEIPSGMGASDRTIPGIYGTGPASAGVAGTEDWDVTTFVQSCADGTPNYGMFVWVDPASGGLNSEWHSRESATTTARPMLVIDYVPEPASVGMLALGGLLALRRRR